VPTGVTLVPVEWVLIAGAAVAVAGYVVGRRQRTRRQADNPADLALLQRVLDEDVTALGEDLQQLDRDLVGEDLDEGSRTEFKRALDAYDRAKDALTSVRRADDTTRVTAAIGDGRFAMACLHARRAGLPRPERRPPCFFDPRHGPATADVRWAPPGGTMREVPACAQDAERVRGGGRPDMRKVWVGGHLVPHWRAGAAYRPLQSGYYGTDSQRYFTDTSAAWGIASAHQFGQQHASPSADFGGDFGGGGDGAGTP